MNHFRFARLLPWLVISLCPPLLGHCGGAVEHGTETGNPPVVEQQKLHVVLHEDGVLVVADPGAVPAGATVAVTNARSGDRSEATAGADGSVSVSVPGTLDDEYEVTVSSGGRSQTVRVSASTGGSDLASASCDSLEQTLSARVATAYAAASKACQVDSDCTPAPAVGCYGSCGGPEAISTASVEAAQQVALQSIASVCDELDSRCGARRVPFCPTAAIPSVGCNDGTCQVLSCGDLQGRLSQHRSDIVALAPRGCTVDADCTLLQTSVRCIADCGSYASVSAPAADQVKQQVSSEEDTICRLYQSKACPEPEALPCDPAAPPRAACVAGKCDLAYTQF